MSNKYFNQVITPLIKTVQEKGNIPSCNRVSMPALQHEDKHKAVYLMLHGDSTKRKESKKRQEISSFVVRRDAA